MNNITIGSELIQFLSFGSAFAFGLVKFFNARFTLYFKIITCSLGCYALGKLFSIVNVICFGNIPNDFHVGYFGLLGCFLFLLAANLDSNNSLLDDNENSNIQKKFFSLALPIIFAIIIIVMFIMFNSIREKLIICIFVPAIFALYYSMKILIFSNNNVEFFHIVKLCNIFMIAFYITTFLQIVAYLKKYVYFEMSCKILTSFLAWLIILAIFQRKKTSQNK